ncbi:MAG: hypothetical protein ABI041_13580, partial [Bdellovibrionia bacterium]
MKFHSSRSWIWVLLILILIGNFTLSCGAPESETGYPAPAEMNPETPSNSPPHPYPDVHGTEVHGDKNFAALINGYAQAKSDP